MVRISVETMEGNSVPERVLSCGPQGNTNVGRSIKELDGPNEILMRTEQVIGAPQCWTDDFCIPPPRHFPSYGRDISNTGS
jgi:hypothetical protein